MSENEDDLVKGVAGVRITLENIENDSDSVLPVEQNTAKRSPAKNDGTVAKSKPTKGRIVKSKYMDAKSNTANPATAGSPRSRSFMWTAQNQTTGGSSSSNVTNYVAHNKRIPLSTKTHTTNTNDGFRKPTVFKIHKLPTNPPAPLTSRRRSLSCPNNNATDDGNQQTTEPGIIDVSLQFNSNVDNHLSKPRCESVSTIGHPTSMAARGVIVSTSSDEGRALSDISAISMLNASHFDRSAAMTVADSTGATIGSDNNTGGLFRASTPTADISRAPALQHDASAISVCLDTKFVACYNQQPQHAPASVVNEKMGCSSKGGGGVVCDEMSVEDRYSTAYNEYLQTFYLDNMTKRGLELLQDNTQSQLSELYEAVESDSCLTSDLKGLLEQTELLHEMQTDIDRQIDVLRPITEDIKTVKDSFADFESTLEMIQQLSTNGELEKNKDQAACVNELWSLLADAEVLLTSPKPNFLASTDSVINYSKLKTEEQQLLQQCKQIKERIQKWTIEEVSLRAVMDSAGSGGSSTVQCTTIFSG